MGQKAPPPLLHPPAHPYATGLKSKSPYLKKRLHVVNVQNPQEVQKEIFSLDPRGGLGIFTDRDHRSIFLGFEFRKFVFSWVPVTDAVFLGGC